MADNKNNVPQFVACGLEMGNRPRQIPYDMSEHERIIMAELLDKVYTELEKYKREINLANTPWNFIELVFSKMKAEVSE